MGSALAPVPAFEGARLGAVTAARRVSISRLPSGRWRAQIYDPASGRNVSVSAVLGGVGSFRTKAEAKAARERARARLNLSHGNVTVADFAARWTSDPLFARPKQSTNLHNAERVSGFVRRYGQLRLSQVDDAVVARWLAGGRNTSTVPALRAMFNDARSAGAGRLIETNPSPV